MDAEISNSDSSDTVQGFLFVPKYTGHDEPRFGELVFPYKDWAVKTNGNEYILVGFKNCKLAIKHKYFPALKILGKIKGYKKAKKPDGFHLLTYSHD